MNAADRVQVARALTSAQDAKAAAVLGAAGLLLTAGGVLTAFGHPGPSTLALARMAGGATSAGVLALLVSLYPRGGSPWVWLRADQQPESELRVLARLASVKHRCLQVGIWSLQVAVWLAGLAVIAS